MKPIIILNGPAGCGKDTIAGLLQSHCGLVINSFKAPMFDIVQSMLGKANFQVFMARYEDRKLKEENWPVIGCSPRQLMIKISEDFVKPVMGQAVFGHLAADSTRTALEQGAPGVVFSDGGFPSEAEPLRDIGGSYVFVVRLYREGYNYNGDSRNYFPASDLDITLFEGQPQWAAIQIVEALNERV